VKNITLIIQLWEKSLKNKRIEVWTKIRKIINSKKLRIFKKILDIVMLFTVLYRVYNGILFNKKSPKFLIIMIVY
jgi:hypothetical protein